MKLMKNKNKKQNNHRHNNDNKSNKSNNGQDHEPEQEQQKRDELWLGYFCDSVNWASRVGKKRNIFRNPKI